ncbi:membrane protein [Flavobacterium subsaxonicum WB 4.1-42 = DSM 21790]|uniref:Membrane protein n=1 Tax=Flavobacterium subsaxonicum WB 4.1-42 = DSM 21790 TaxID=1121898 RepID=A0A0A2MM21_9FLAO|nr:membrane protein [Flavobacterium subsaxonicum WB 4.1-42 = DSM 21790]
MFLIKRAIWIYFFLVIFEGAIRKWILPALSTPLLVAREPFTIYIIILSIRNRLFPASISLPLLILISILSFFAAVFFGHQNIFVALFGARIFLLHIPVMFIIAQVFNNDDIVKMGRIMLWITLLMAIIIFLQFYSPQTAWINRGVGGNESGGGFQGAMGYLRPPGTFSFTSGTTSFFSFAAPFVAFFWLSADKIKVNRALLIAATFSVIIAIPLSISRTLFFNVGLVLLFTIFISIRNPVFLTRILVALVVMFGAYTILSQQESVQTAIEVFTARFENANESEGGLEGVLIDRFLGGMYNALFSGTNAPLWGYGIGMGSNVGAMLLAGSTAFLLPEGEWGRLIGEIGMIMGLIVIFIRISMGAGILTKAYFLLSKKQILPWLLLSTGLIVVLQGQWGQPTNLGFFVIITGVLMASVKQN